MLRSCASAHVTSQQRIGTILSSGGSDMRRFALLPAYPKRDGRERRGGALSHLGSQDLREGTPSRLPHD